MHEGRVARLPFGINVRASRHALFLAPNTRNCPFPPAHILPPFWYRGGWYNSIVTHRIIYLECWRVVALLYCSRDLLGDNKNVVSSLGGGKSGR